MVRDRGYHPPMHRWIDSLFAALGVARQSTLLESLERVEARLGGLEGAAERRDRELADLRESLEKLESRVALVDRRATLRGRMPEPEADLDALEGSLNHLAHRLGRVEDRQDGTRPEPRRLTFLTSISPVDLDRQERAVRGWLRYGDVVSFNGSEEGARIRAALHDREESPLAEVVFSAVSETADEEVGKPCVYVDSMLEFIDANPEAGRAFAIVNSDVVLELDGLVENGTPVDTLLDLLEVGPIFGSRVDVREDLEPAESELTLADGTYFWGFDYFLLTAVQVAPLTRHRFVFGQPWWDYYLPFELLHRHGVLFYLENRIALHVQHSFRWNKANFELMEERFGAYLSSVGRAPEADRGAKSFCREIRRRATRMRLPRPTEIDRDSGR